MYSKARTRWIQARGERENLILYRLKNLNLTHVKGAEAIMSSLTELVTGAASNLTNTSVSKQDFEKNVLRDDNYRFIWLEWIWHISDLRFRC